MSRESYIIANWKMNHQLSHIGEFFESLTIEKSSKVHAWISPQAFHLPILLGKIQTKDLNIQVGVQNICDHESGAYTGELSSLSAKDCGATFTLVGHSERRSLYQEGDDTLNKKVHQALSSDLEVIFCIGETLEEREAGQTPDVVKIQLVEGLEGITKEQAANIIIAYEPVWAIGTGKVASAEEVNDVHEFIRSVLTKDLSFMGEDMIVVYGGSVKPDNAESLLSKPHIDGALVGGASLKGDSFSQLIKIAERSSYLQ
jgi:triosephosphate isomerase